MCTCLWSVLFTDVHAHSVLRTIYRSACTLASGRHCSLPSMLTGLGYANKASCCVLYIIQRLHFFIQSQFPLSLEVLTVLAWLLSLASLASRRLGLALATYRASGALSKSKHCSGRVSFFATLVIAFGLPFCILRRWLALQKTLSRPLRALSRPLRAL